MSVYLCLTILAIGIAALIAIAVKPLDSGPEIPKARRRHF